MRPWIGRWLQFGAWSTLDVAHHCFHDHFPVVLTERFRQQIVPEYATKGMAIGDSEKA